MKAKKSSTLSLSLKTVPGWAMISFAFYIPPKNWDSFLSYNFIKLHNKAKIRIWE